MTPAVVAARGHALRVVPTQSRALLGAGVLVAVLALTACSTSTPSATATATGAYNLLNCPVTVPGPAPADIGASLFGASSAVGNESLWVGGLGPSGVISATGDAISANGSIGWKLGWWREVSGDLTITGMRLDGDAPPLEADVPSGYGPTGFQASGVTFPTTGCWQVTGHVGSASLTFVTYITKG